MSENKLSLRAEVESIKRFQAPKIQKGKQLKSRWIFRTLEAAAQRQQKLTLAFSIEVSMSKVNLTPEQEAEAQRLAELFVEKAKEEALNIARLLVSKQDHEILGATEFQVREGFTNSVPMPSKPLSMSGKKGVPRVEHDLSTLR